MTAATATKTRKSSMLAVGTIVIFSVVPLGSYLTPGRTYRIEHIDRRAVHFRNVATGTGTFDDKRAIDRSTFAVVA